MKITRDVKELAKQFGNRMTQRTAALQNSYGELPTVWK